jgi:hypothetical protein
MPWARLSPPEYDLSERYWMAVEIWTPENSVSRVEVDSVLAQLPYSLVSSPYRQKLEEKDQANLAALREER